MRVNPNTALRLHLTEDCDEVAEPIKSPPDVEIGLKYWRELNATPNRWATFKAHQFTHTRVVIVDWGYKHTDGFNERAIETIIFTMLVDEVYVSHHANY